MILFWIPFAFLELYFSGICLALGKEGAPEGAIEAVMQDGMDVGMGDN
jgi:hypothetical protein